MSCLKQLSCLPCISRQDPKSVLYAQQHSSKKLSLATGIVVTALFFVIPASSQAASLTFVDERADLQGNDQVDWSSLGFTSPVEVLPNNFSATSEQGLKLNVQIPQAIQSPDYTATGVSDLASPTWCSS